MHHAHSHFARHQHDDALHFELPHRTRGIDFGGIVSDIGGVFKGVAEGAVDTVTGIAEAVTNPVDTATGIASLVTDPTESWPALWHGLTNPIVEDWKSGNEGEAIGRGIFGVLEVIVGSKGVSKVGKVVTKAPDVPDARRPDVPTPDAPKPDVPKPDAPAPDAPGPRAIDAADDLLKQAPRTYRAKELNHASKHADDFGVTMRTDPKLVTDANPNGIATPSNAERSAFSDALERHVNSPDTLAIKGSYRRNDVTFFVDPTSGLTAFYGADGAFKGGWKLNESQLRKLLDEGYFQ